MNRLRRPHLIALAVVVAAIAAPPAAALAAGEESSDGASPASTGWVPQGSGNESSDSGTTSVRHGSSLGSGASSKPADPPSGETSYTPPSSSSYEAPSSASVSGEATSPTSTGTEPSVVKHPVVAPPVVEYAPVGLGAAVRVSAPEPTPVAETKPVAPAPAEPVAAASHDQVSSGSGPNPLTSLALLGLIVGGIVLAYVVRRELRAGQAMSRGTYLRH